MSEKYEFIETLLTAAVYPIYLMCRWLSGFRDWPSRPTSATAARRAELAFLVEHVFTASDETYGYRRVHAELARSGVTVGPDLVRQLMRELDLVPYQPHPFRHNLPAQDADQPTIPDLSSATSPPMLPGQRWSATFPPTREVPPPTSRPGRGGSTWPP